MLYFAYGSNMSSARLAARVGAVRVVGAATLSHHRHAFASLGQDGTGKGAIAEHAGGRVLGVAYELTVAQFDELNRYEGGYERRAIDIATGAGAAAAETYYPLDWDETLRPEDWYVDHYLAGMREHRFPDDYIETILAQAGLAGSRQG